MLMYRKAKVLSCNTMYLLEHCHPEAVDQMREEEKDGSSEVGQSS